MAGRADSPILIKDEDMDVKPEHLKVEQMSLNIINIDSSDEEDALPLKTSKEKHLLMRELKALGQTYQPQPPKPPKPDYTKPLDEPSWDEEGDEEDVDFEPDEEEEDEELEYQEMEDEYLEDDEVKGEDDDVEMKWED